MEFIAEYACGDYFVNYSAEPVETFQEAVAGGQKLLDQGFCAVQVKVIIHQPSGRVYEEVIWESNTYSNPASSKHDDPDESYQAFLDRPAEHKFQMDKLRKEILGK